MRQMLHNRYVLSTLIHNLTGTPMDTYAATSQQETPRLTAPVDLLALCRFSPLSR